MTMALKTKQPDAIEAALQPRVSKGLIATDIRDLRRQRHVMLDSYRGGLPAEQQSRKAADQATRKAARMVILRGRGRRIDLAALLNESTPAGQPMWTIVDPRQPIGAYNGTWTDINPKSEIVIGLRIGGDSQLLRQYFIDQNGLSGLHPKGLKNRGIGFTPVGMPPLPQRVREIIHHATTRKSSRESIAWLGVLYQPDSWVEFNPDPALIVEYKDLPGEYYALAVWGGDRARIMEFVD